LARDFSGRLTALVIEPDEAVQRQMLGLLAARGLRVVPVANADTGLELVAALAVRRGFLLRHAPA